MTSQQSTNSFTRRQFLITSAAGTTGLALARWADAACGDKTQPVSFGLVADIHYADIPTKGIRYYRDSLTKLHEAVETFKRRKVDFVVELGDFCDAGASKKDDLDYLHSIRRVFEEFKGSRHYVLGNHDVTPA